MMATLKCLRCCTCASSSSSLPKPLLFCQQKGLVGRLERVQPHCTRSISARGLKTCSITDKFKVTKLANNNVVLNSISRVAATNVGARFITSQSTVRVKQSKPFPVIDADKSFIDREGSEFIENSERYRKAADVCQQAEAVSLEGGGEKSIERHVKRHGKMIVTDRIKALVDDVEDFLELSLVGGVGMKYGHVPRANTLTGIGKVNGHYCMIMAGDGSFKGGAIYPITLKKNLRAQEIARQNRIPCIMIVDSAGAFLPLQADIFNEGGRTFYNEAVLGSENIPQIAIVCGSCTAGGAYIPTMADEAVIVHKIGSLYLAGPPLVKAALGEIVSSEDLGGATVHCGTSGCTDYFALSEADAFEIGRDIVSSLNLEIDASVDLPDYDDPIYDVEEIPGIIPPPHRLHEMNMYPIIARLVDGSRFHEFKGMFGRSLLTGFAHIQGHLVGLIANQQGDIGEAEGAKGTHFIQICCERGIPLVFLQNTAASSEMLPGEDAFQMSLKLKSQGRMFAAVSCATVPKLTVLVGNGLGPTHYIMGGNATSPNFVFAWPNARVAIMEPGKLAQTVAQQKAFESGSEEVDEDELQKMNEKYQRESSAIYAATHILNDGVIRPQETRKVLSQCLSICRAYKRQESQDYPVIRM